jgi:O-antigen ligase
MKRRQIRSRVDVSFDWREGLPLAAFMVGCLVLGGASNAGLIANALVEIACLGIFGWAMIKRGKREFAVAERSLCYLALAFAGVIVVHLVPLPYAIWTVFPGRAPVVLALHLAGIPDGAMPLSLYPHRTVGTLLGMIPALALVAILPKCGRPSVGIAVCTVLAVAMFSAFLALFQVSGGRGGLTYLYENTNLGDGVGLFANANHLATLMVVSVPLAFGFAAALQSRTRSLRQSSFAWIAACGVTVLAALGVAASRSLAGGGLMMLMLLGSAPIVFPKLSRPLYWIGSLIAVVVVVGVAGYKLTRTSALSTEGLSRPYMWHVTLDALQHFLPFGSGFGSFVRVFHLFEDPGAVTPVYANHAHNDLLEFILEGGVPAVVLLGLFLTWFARRCYAAWRGDDQDALSQAATLAIGVMLLHSLVDYPLRTTAIASVFGLCCAVAARPRRGSERIAVPAEAPVVAGKHLSA